MKLWCLYTWKKWTGFLTSFLRYCKRITILLLWVLWEYLIMPINNNNTTLQEALMTKMLKSTYWKLWCSSACKKSTLSLASFLRYCKDIANLLLWEPWQCLNIPIIVSICRKLSCLSDHSLFFNFFFWVIWSCLVTHI